MSCKQCARHREEAEKRIVDWLRSETIGPWHIAADAIERGDHHSGEQ